MRRRPKHQIPTKYILLSMTALCILAMYVSFSLNLGGRNCRKRGNYKPFGQGKADSFNEVFPWQNSDGGCG